MRKSHYALIAVAIATISYVTAAPGQARAPQEAERLVPADPELTPEQQADLDSWSPQQQLEYAAWPAETKRYYWSLVPNRQALFWALADTDKIALTAMTGPEREAKWERIEYLAGAQPGEV